MFPLRRRHFAADFDSFGDEVPRIQPGSGGFLFAPRRQTNRQTDFRSRKASHSQKQNLVPQLVLQVTIKMMPRGLNLLTVANPPSLYDPHSFALW